MRNSNAVVLDVDGVLADFEGAFCDKFGWQYRNMTKLEYRYPAKSYEIGTFSLASRTYEYLDIVELGVKIARFCENERFNIHVISSRPAYTERITGTWLKQNKIPFHFLSTENGSKTFRIERAKPLFVVDDLLSVCEECANIEIPSFLIDQPWNQKEDLDGIIYRIKTFDDFLFVFDNYFDV